MVVHRSEKIAVLSSNGAGKSTLFLTLLGFSSRKEVVSVSGDENLLIKKAEITELRGKIGIVFQDPDSQLFSASVYQDISFGSLNLRFSEERVAYSQKNGQQSA